MPSMGVVVEFFSGIFANKTYNFTQMSSLSTFDQVPPLVMELLGCGDVDGHLVKEAF